MPNPKPPYPPEFRAEASVSPEHRAIRSAPWRWISGSPNESLRRWVIQAEIDRGDSPGLTSVDKPSSPASDARTGPSGSSGRS